MRDLWAFFIAFFISVAGMPIIIRFAHRNGIVDKPNGRKIHIKPVPLMGGLAIFIGIVVPLVIFTKPDFRLISIVVSAAILAVLGMLDDIYNIEAKKKLVVQLLCALFVVISGVKVNISQYMTDNAHLAFIIDGLISVLWIIGIINAINLIDGVDGLAGGVSLIAALGFTFILGEKDFDHTAYIIALCVAGSMLGYLFYNFYPAKVFMGDMGSTLIGILLAVVGIAGLDVPDNSASIWAPIIILAVPIFDTGLAIIRRAVRKRSLFSADKEHLHHMFLKKGFSQRQTVFIFYIFAAVAALLGVIVYKKRYFYLGLIIVVMLIMVGIMLNMNIFTKVRKFIGGKAFSEAAYTKEEEVHPGS